MTWKDELNVLMKELILLIDLYRKTKDAWDDYNSSFVKELKAKRRRNKRIHLQQARSHKISIACMTRRESSSSPHINITNEMPMHVKPIAKRLRKVFHLLARILHPDKGGDGASFSKLLNDYDNEDYVALLIHMFKSTKIIFCNHCDLSDIGNVRNEIKKIKSSINMLKNSLAWRWGESRSID